MSSDNNSDQPDQSDSSPSAFSVVAIPLGVLVPDEVLEEVEIFITKKDDGDDDGDGVALSS